MNRWKLHVDSSAITMQSEI